MQAVATRADRRITFVDENWMWGEDRERENVAYRMTVSGQPTAADLLMFDEYRAYHYCAEPSPDVSEDVLSRLVSRIGDGQLRLGAEVEGESDIEALFRRSQGVQLFRDGLFALCQAHHNGAVGAENYGVFIGSLIERSSYLIALELALGATADPGAESAEMSDLIRAALGHLAPKERRTARPGSMMVTSELE
jgi:hypothetical protein